MIKLLEGIKKFIKGFVKTEYEVQLKEEPETKRKTSNKVYAIKDKEFIISDSAKLLGDYFGKSKDIIKNCLRQPTCLIGYQIYYADPKKREEIKQKMLSKRSIRNKNYMKILEYLDKSSVETIEKDYNVKYITYWSEVE